MVNPDVDGYTKTPHNRKKLRKRKKATTYWTPKKY